MRIPPKRKQAFMDAVWDYYKENKRAGLPWRKGISAYKVFVSELMLQQTQVERVIPFFERWIKEFPTVEALANAPQIRVLELWKGLGYNSRALRMKKAAQAVVEQHGGKFPKSLEGLVDLPGIGPYTAGAIMAFAYNEPTPFIETNIRRVYLHHFYPSPLRGAPLIKGSKGFESSSNISTEPAPSFRGGARRAGVSDKELFDLIAQTIDQKNPREWYWALMDYGAHLGRTLKIDGKKFNPNVKSRHYTKQSKFEGSDRQIRSRILDLLLKSKNRKMPLDAMLKKLSELSNDDERVGKILDAVEKEGFVTVTAKTISLN